MRIEIGGGETGALRRIIQKNKESKLVTAKAYINFMLTKKGCVRRGW
jgi:hypothetical protein